MRNLTFFLVYFFIASYSYAQGIRGITLDESVNGKTLTSFFEELEKKHEIDFVFNQERGDKIIVTGVTKNTYLGNYLHLLLSPAKLKVVKAMDNVFFIIDEQSFYDYGKSGGNYLVLAQQAKQKQLIEGTLKDIDSGDPIVGAQVVIPKTGAGVLTNEKGYFRLEVPNDIYAVEFRYVGYETVSYIVAFSPYSQNSDIETEMLPSQTELRAVTVTAEGSERNVKSIVPGIEKLGIETIKELPAFLGEVDPVKSLTTLPGVSTVGELSSGINVRGGETGQNLIIQDGAVIYNPTHLFGFFSAFNPDFVSDVALYKGGGPANFGGRVSSVLDVKLRNGDAVRHRVTGGAGLVASRLGIEGPIVKNKASYLIGGRVSYSDWLLKATDNLQLVNSSAEFYDVTAKVFTTINSNNFLSITGYRSNDSFRLASDSTIGWGTTNGSIRWDHKFNESLLSTLTLSSSNYHSSIQSVDFAEAFLYQNSINNIWLKYDMALASSEDFDMNFGIEGNAIKLEPGKIEPAAGVKNVLPVDLNDQNGLESAAYWQGNINLSEKWALGAGIRYSHFVRFGEDMIYKYDYNNIIGRYPAVLDSVNFGKGEIISTYGGFEPRISLRYLINEGASLKASFYRSYQYLHLISNTTTSVPQDYWVTSGPGLKPAKGDQVSLGYFRNLDGDAFEFSVEGYYKETENAVDYIEGADISLNKYLEGGLVSGKGVAYGLEVLARKNKGVMYGWVSYTYSRSLRQFKSVNQLESINNGDYYPSAYDQPHNLSVILNFKLGPATIFSGNFSYSTGRPITIPVSKFSYDAYLSVLNYSERNEYRIPDYHRLDLSLTFKGKPKKNFRFRGDWVFSVINVYARKNAYSIFFSRYGTAKKLAILGNAFPSVTYNFSF